MKSKWFDLKEKALSFRRKGYSIRNIEKRLKIPRSTLSGWFIDVKLTELQRDNLEEYKRRSLVRARNKAVLWHNTEKQKRVERAEREANNVLSELKFNDKNILELSLAMLYWGEGFKKSGGTGIGNSDPEILQFFISATEKCFYLKRQDVKCELHLRADQNLNDAKKYWSKKLKIPLQNFVSVSFDKRTLGTKTFESYKGVCVLRIGKIEIQRRLMFLCRKFCKKVIS